MTECKAADEDSNAGKYGIEEVEGSHGAYADEVKQRPLNT
jgi:hypothetical protein